MRRTIGAGLTLIVVVFLFSQTVVTQGLLPIIVRTRSGLVRGEIAGPLRSFRGIPFAHRPLAACDGARLPAPLDGTMFATPESASDLNILRLVPLPRWFRTIREALLYVNRDARIGRLFPRRTQCERRFSGF